MRKTIISINKDDLVASIRVKAGVAAHSLQDDNQTSLVKHHLDDIYEGGNKDFIEETAVTALLEAHSHLDKWCPRQYVEDPYADSDEEPVSPDTTDEEVDVTVPMDLSELYKLTLWTPDRMCGYALELTGRYIMEYVSWLTIRDFMETLGQPNKFVEEKVAEADGKVRTQFLRSKNKTTIPMTQI